MNTGYDNGALRNPILLRLYTKDRSIQKMMENCCPERFDIFDRNSGMLRDVFVNVIVDRQVNQG